METFLFKQRNSQAILILEAVDFEEVRVILHEVVKTPETWRVNNIEGE